MNLADKIFEILIHVKKDEFEEAYKVAQERLAVIYNSYFSCEADGLRRSLNSRADVETVKNSKMTLVVTKADDTVVDVSNTVVDVSHPTVDVSNTVVDVSNNTINKVVDIQKLTKKEQRQMERDKNAENKKNKISYKKLMTKENLYKWKIEEKMSAARIAREILGCREEIVGSELKKHQII